MNKKETFEKFLESLKGKGKGQDTLIESVKQGFQSCFEMMGATKKGEYYRTCEMLVNIAEEKGVYFAVAFLYDSSYTMEDVKAMLPILQGTKGAIKNEQ